MTMNWRRKQAKKTQTDRRVPVEGLRWHCPATDFGVASTAEVEPTGGVIGQNEAVEALRFGLEIAAPGQNVYVRGLTGSGRSTLVQRLIREVEPACPPAADRLYVHNFQDPDEPALVTLPRGQSRGFVRRVEELIVFLREKLFPSLESDRVKERRTALERETGEALERISAPLQKELEQNALALVMVDHAGGVRPVILPVVDGEPVSPEQVRKLMSEGRWSQTDLDALERRIEEFGKRFEEVNERIMKLRKEHGEKMRALLVREIRALLSLTVKEIETTYSSPAVSRFLAGVVEDVVDHQMEVLGEGNDWVRRYRPNLLVSHDQDGCCPVVVEAQPTLLNLVGNIDRHVLPTGAVYADHLMIKAGSLLKADSGFLVLEAQEVLREPGAWRALVRTLRTGQLEIRPHESLLFGVGASIKPESIPVNVKVVLIGDPDIHSALDALDPDFPHLFKVLSDFDTSFPRTPQTLRDYARVLGHIAVEEALPPFGAEAIAALAEHGARIAGRQDRLTARFGRVADLAREAAFLCRKQERSEVTAADVGAAVRRSRRRADLPARRFREMIVDGTIRIPVTGERAGQIHGLAVTQVGPLTYGFPARITATIAPGRAGAVHIDRESDLSGSIHTKGFYILEGLLRNLLGGAGHPLAFSASIVFEQSYGSIDGDSASGAEMCCLLSALIDVPIRQGIAMTGSIDQFGDIQAVGAVTEKIEGFFDVCSERGLTGGQGVIIPRANLTNLMLREDVVDACRNGRFGVWGVETIAEALEILTGIEAGVADDDGVYPEGTLFRRAIDRSAMFWAMIRASAEG